MAYIASGSSLDGCNAQRHTAHGTLTPFHITRIYIITSAIAIRRVCLFVRSFVRSFVVVFVNIVLHTAEYLENGWR